RTLVIFIPASAILRRNNYSKGSLTTMFWGGIRGGASLALVLSIPNSVGDIKHILLEVTEIVVLFAIYVQGLSVGTVAKKVINNDSRECSCPRNFLYNVIGWSVPPCDNTFFLNFVAISLLKIPFCLK